MTKEDFEIGPMQLTIDVTEEQLRGLLITAVEGGYTRAWAAGRNYNPHRAEIALAERDDDGKPAEPWHEVTATTMLEGLKRAARAKDSEGGWAFASWLKDRIGDAIIADIILQFAVLGRVKYG